MEEREVRSLIEDVLETKIEEMECPTCKGWRPMVKWVEYKTDDSPEFVRCMGCLTVFEEKLEEVK